MHSSSPFFSVIVPVYNAGKTLRETIESVINQTYQKWELILVDDCSNDNSKNIIRQYSIVFPNIIEKTLSHNTGSAKIPCDVGMSISRGNYCIILGNDDLLSINYLECIYKRIKETTADVVLSKCDIRDYKTKRLLSILPKKDVEFNISYSGKEACLMTMTSWDICCNGMAFQKRLYDNVLKDNPFNYMNSDEYSSRIILIHANKVVFANGVYTYWQLKTSVTHKISVKLFESLYVDAQLIDFALLNYGKDLAQRMYIKFLCHMIVMQKQYYRYKKTFSHEEKKIIGSILYNNFSRVKQLRQYCNSLATYAYSFNILTFKLLSKIIS